jgi:hypothetical protein
MVHDMAEDTNAGTTPTTPEAQPQAGTPVVNDEVTTLRSRNQGLDAKVTELLSQVAAAAAARDAATARLTEYETGKAGESEAARARIESLTAELAATQRLAQANAMAAKYPETFAVYGEAIAGMSEDVLAAGEARLRGVTVESAPPVPVANNAPRTPAVAAKPIEEMNAAELREHGRSAFAGLTWDGISQDQGD